MPAETILIFKIPQEQMADTRFLERLVLLMTRVTFCHPNMHDCFR